MLPRILEETVDAYFAQIQRDFHIGELSASSVSRDLMTLADENPYLAVFMARAAERFRTERGGAMYLLGAMHVYALLKRQREINDLEKKSD